MSVPTLETMEYPELVSYVQQDVLSEVGETKFQRIFEKVDFSDKISGLINASRIKRFVPGSKDFVYSVNEITFFIFKNQKIKTIASLLALRKWDIEVNQNLKLLDDEGLAQKAKAIIQLHKAYKYEL